MHNINKSQDTKLNDNNSPKNGLSFSNIYNSSIIENNGSVKNIKNMSEYIKKYLYRQKKKESKNITLNQIIKNSDIYSSELL